MSDEHTQRMNVVRIARTWIGTPYLSNAMVRGAGADCATLLVGVYREAGMIPPDFDPRPYPTQWHLHQSDEQYMKIVMGFARMIEPPPLPGDVVLFKLGRVFAHGGIVSEWPNIIHARAPGRVWEEDASRDSFGKHALWRLEQRFFSYWPG